MDPLESKFAGRTPYCYAANNPVVFNDPSGTREKPANKQTDLGGVNYKQPEQLKGYSAKDPAGRNMFLPENISISEDRKNLLAKGENRSWDIGSWNEELGDYEFTKLNSEFESPDFDKSSHKEVSYATFAAGALLLGGTASVAALGIAILATAAILLTVSAVLDYRANSKSEPISRPVAVPIPDDIAIPDSRKKQHDFSSVRLQVQTGKENISSNVQINTIESGVTKAQGYLSLSTVYSEAILKDPSLAENKDFRAAIIQMSMKIKAVKGGLTKGPYQTTLQEKFIHQKLEYRVDLEVERGVNFKK